MFKRFTLTLAAALLVVAAALLVSHVGTFNLAPSPAFAGTGSLQTSSSDSFSGVSVSGTGKVSVKPNIATSSIGIQVTATTLADATSQANAKMAAVIDKIKSFGVADKDIQTTNYNVQPITEQPRPNGETPRITGYNVNNQVSVTVRKIDDLGKILDAAVAAGANNIYGISFGIDDPTPYQEQARAAAVKDAMDKASQLAKAGGVTLGKIIWISEGSNAPTPVFRAAAAPGFAGGSAVPVETGQLEISVSVDMRFALP